MGAPMFTIRDLCQREGVVVFSSNYTLYGDMSRRMNTVYERFASDIEVYSIDESFLDMSPVAPGQREEMARDLRSTVSTWTGVPTCVGIGPTKTLAKLANKIAKSTPQLRGVCDLTSDEARSEWLPLVHLEDVWGIGRASQAKLAAFGCRTAADVAALDPKLARKSLTVVGERVIHELRGAPCIDLESVAPTRKGCAVTRSFVGRVESLDMMQEALPPMRPGSARSCAIMVWRRIMSRSSSTHRRTIADPHAPSRRPSISPRRAMTRSPSSARPSGGLGGSGSLGTATPRPG